MASVKTRGDPLPIPHKERWKLETLFRILRIVLDAVEYQHKRTKVYEQGGTEEDKL